MLTFIDKYPTSASVIFSQVTTTSFTEPVYQPDLKKNSIWNWNTKAKIPHLHLLKQGTRKYKIMVPIHVLYHYFPVWEKIKSLNKSLSQNQPNSFLSFADPSKKGKLVR